MRQQCNLNDMLRRSTNEISIRPKWSRDRKIAIASLVIISLVGLLFGSYRMGYRKANFDSVEHGSYITRLEKDLNVSKSKARKLSQELAVAQREVQVQQAAYVGINKDYQKVESKNEELGRKLDFYRSIIAPEDGVSGVKIHDVRTTLNEEGLLDFEVVMIQSIHHDANSRVTIMVELLPGKRARKATQTWPTSGSKVIEFRYSEVIKGIFENVEAKSGAVLRITARPNNSTDKQLVEWHEL